MWLASPHFPHPTNPRLPPVLCATRQTRDLEALLVGVTHKPFTMLHNACNLATATTLSRRLSPQPPPPPSSHRSLVHPTEPLTRLQISSALTTTTTTSIHHPPLFSLSRKTQDLQTYEPRNRTPNIEPLQYTSCVLLKTHLTHLIISFSNKLIVCHKKAYYVNHYQKLTVV